MQNPFRDILFVFAAAVLVTSAAACAAPSYKPPEATSQGTGPMSIHDASPASGSESRSVTIKFSLDFAKCMRAHGVPDFPDPDENAGRFDPGSAAFQAAVNGPCQSLAPPAWVASGQVGVGS